MADIQRGVDLSKVVERLAQQGASKDQRIAMLEVAFEDAVASAKEMQDKVEELERANRELQERVDLLEGK